jgi:hypothetical protein
MKFYFLYFRTMFKPLRLLFIAFLLISTGVKAQKLYKNVFNGPYLLLYKLSAGQVDSLVRNKVKVDSQFLYSKLVGKVRSDSVFPLRRKPIDDYPVKPFTDLLRYNKFSPRFHVWDLRENGYYLEVYVSNINQVTYRLLENPLFRSGVHKIGYETYVFVEDSSALPVSNVKVHLDTATCIYDSSVGGYRIPGKKMYGVLKIERGSEFVITVLQGNVDNTNNTVPPRDNYSYSKIKYQGYLVTNKPRYKTYDTLYFKSFLVNAKGKPIKEKLTVILYQDYGTYRKQIQLRPSVKGDYSGYFVISDSFLIDHELNLLIYNRRGVYIKTQKVMLENYELKDLFFELKTDKNLVTPGAGIKIYASATTANRLPIMDGKLSLKMSATNINFTDKDSVVIPFSKIYNWFSATVQTDPSGVTIFEIPDSVFIALDGTFSVSCTLTTADNEIRVASVNFNYQTTRDRLVSVLKTDTLFVKRLYNMQSVKRKMRIKLYSSKDLLVDSFFSTPYKGYLPPNIYFAQIFTGDTLSGTFYRQTQLPEVWGKRSHDSVRICFKSSFDVPVFFRIYANNKLVHSGKSSQLTWQIKDRSKNSYHLQYGILEGSVISPRFYSKSFHLAEKELTVTIQQPEIVYPGQQVAVQIQVKNAYGKPVNKVNLAAWAVNTQLDNIVVPDIPYLGLVKTQKPLPTINIPTVSIPQYYQSSVSAWQLSAFYLLENKVFNLVYPKGGFEVLTDTTPRRSTEIDFYTHGQKQRMNIVYVKANDTLIYSQFQNPKTGSMRINAGIYDFTIRTFDHIYKFKNVKITQGFKNFVCLNTDSLFSHQFGDTISPGILTPEEQSLISNSSLLLRYDQVLNDTLLVKVNGKLVHAFANAYDLQRFMPDVVLSTAAYNPDKSISKQRNMQAFKMFGPINAGDNLELIWKNSYAHNLKYQPETSYSLTKNDLVTELHAKWGEQIKFLQFASSLPYSFNSFWWDPYFKDTTKVKQPSYISPKNTYRTVTTLEAFQYSNYIHPNTDGKLSYNSSLHLYFDIRFNPQKLWLFDTDDSSYSILQNNNVLNYQYPNIGKGVAKNVATYTTGKRKQNFRLVMEMNDSTWYVKDLSIDSSVFLFLTSELSQYRKLGKREHFLYDRLAKNLAKEPLKVWEDTPSINKGILIIPVAQRNGKITIEGNVIGPAIKYPVADAFVILEKNGLFVNGAITNREGRFKMDNLSPGTYMLKIKGNNYHYWIYYSITLQAGNVYLIQAELKPYARMRYDVVYDENNIQYDMGKYYAPSASYTSPQSMMASGANVTLTDGVYRANVFKRDRKAADEDMLDKVSYESEAEDESSELKEVMIVSDVEEKKGWSEEQQQAETQRLKTLAADTNARKTRKDFKDHAYWIPNLYTNKQGMAGFTVKYPDNTTSWQTFVPAMDGKRHSGLGQMVVRSYKPISTSIALPMFLTEGDSLMAYGRVMNYTGNPVTGQFALQHSSRRNSKTVTVDNFYNDSMGVIAALAGDSIRVETSFELSNGYRDAEQRLLVVNPATVISGKSVFMEVASDTTIVFKAQPDDIGMDIAFYNQKLALILEVIQKIESVEVYDNRSLASYLHALLIKKTICELLKIPFTDDKQIRKTMAKLKKSANDQGLFGWFKSSKPNFMVSTVVAEAMFKANNLGYENNTWLNLARTMEKQLPGIEGHERLSYLLCLKNMKRVVDYDSFLKPVKPELLDISEKLSYWRLLTVVR